MATKVETVPGTSRPKSPSQYITSLSGVARLTVPDGCSFAFIQAETQNVRWRDDGIDPTASVGTQLLAGQILEYSGDLASIRFIEETPSAKLNISYYG